VEIGREASLAGAVVERDGKENEGRNVSVGSGSMDDTEDMKLEAIVGLTGGKRPATQSGPSLGVTTTGEAGLHLSTVGSRRVQLVSDSIRKNTVLKQREGSVHKNSSTRGAALIDSRASLERKKLACGSQKRRGRRGQTEVRSVGHYRELSEPPEKPLYNCRKRGMLNLKKQFFEEMNRVDWYPNGRKFLLNI